MEHLTEINISFKINITNNKNKCRFNSKKLINKKDNIID